MQIFPIFSIDLLRNGIKPYQQIKRKSDSINNIFDFLLTIPIYNLSFTQILL